MQKKLWLAGVSKKIYKKWFVLSRKSVSTTRNEAFVEIYVSTVHKNCFFWQKNLKKMVCISRKMLVPPNFNNGFLLAFVFPVSSSNPQIWAFWTKKYQLSNVNEILHVSLFWICWFQIFHLLLKLSNPNAQIWAFWVKTYEHF